MSLSKPERWIFLTDLHICPKTQDRVIDFFHWHFEDIEILSRDFYISQILILGDLINTKSTINTQAIHLLGTYIEQYLKLPSRPDIHILVGNHDFATNIKVNSLSSFATGDNRVYVYDSITALSIDGRKTLMLPYHREDQHQQIFDWIETNIRPEERSEFTVFAHLDLDVPWKRSRFEETNMEEEFGTSKRDRNVLTFKYLEQFRWTFSGHYHKYDTYYNPTNNDIGGTTYIGAILQFNGGDIGDIEKGYMVYDPAANTFQQKLYPNADHFVQVEYQELLKDVVRRGKSDDVDEELSFQSLQKYRNKTVKILGADTLSKEWIETISTMTKKAGWTRCVIPVYTAKDNIHSSFFLEESKSSSKEEQKTISLYDFVSSYIDQLKIDTSKYTHPSSFVPDIKKAMYDLFFSTKEGEEENDEIVIDSSSYFTRNTFDAHISSLEIENFQAIVGKVEMNFDLFPKGIIFVEGINGGGKSSVVDAISWCLFGRTFRENSTVNSMKNDTKRDTYVTLTFQNGYIIKRTRDVYNKEYVSITNEKLNIKEDQLKTQANKYIVDLIGCDFQVFKNVFSFGKTSDFTSLEALEKRRVIESLLHFDQLELCFNHFKTQQQTLSLRTKNLDKEKNDLMKELESVKKNQEFIQYAGEYYLSINTNIQQHKDDISKAEQKLDREIYPAIQKEKELLESNLKDMEMNVARWKLLQENAERGISLLPFAVDIQYEVERLEYLIKHQKEHLNGNDFAFLSSIFESFMDSCRKDEEIHSAQELLSRIQELIVCEDKDEENIHLPENLGIQKKMLEKHKEYKIVTEESKNCLSQYQQLQLKYQQVCRYEGNREVFEMNYKIKCLSNALKELEDIQKQQNNIQEEEKKKNEERTILLFEQVRRKELEIEEVNHKLDIAEFWVNSLNPKKSAGGFRSYCLFSRLQQLNQVFQATLKFLHNSIPSMREEDCYWMLDSELQLVCPPAAETKPTTTTTKHTNDLPYWSQRSSGERKRIELALFLSLFLISYRQSGFTPNCIFLDEVFDSLDQEGQMTFRLWLTEFLHSTSVVEHLFIITHNNLWTEDSGGHLLVSQGTYKLNPPPPSYSVQAKAIINTSVKEKKVRKGGRNNNNNNNNNNDDEKEDGKANKKAKRK
jgi:recombinational DNA repair ATPase RecF